MTSKPTILSASKTRKAIPRMSISTLWHKACEQGYNIDQFTLSVIAAGYKEKEFTAWLDSEEYKTLHTLDGSSDTEQ